MRTVGENLKQVVRGLGAGVKDAGSIQPDIANSELYGQSQVLAPSSNKLTFAPRQLGVNRKSNPALKPTSNSNSNMPKPVGSSENEVNSRGIERYNDQPPEMRLGELEFDQIEEDVDEITRQTSGPGFMFQ